MKQEFLQLAHVYKPSKHGIGGWWMSEKLDGMRCYWDGGITTGVPKEEIPWANQIGDYRLRNKEISTGLWSRYGNVIHAPMFWIEQLPRCPLDGELWIPDATHQEVMATVKDIMPNDTWKSVKLFAFDIPSYFSVFCDREINNANYKKSFQDCIRWLTQRDKNQVAKYYGGRSFRSCYNELISYTSHASVICHKQIELPFNTSQAEQVLNTFLYELVAQGGEGLVVRNPNSTWIPERVHTLLKVKPFQDTEGIVKGFVTGKGKLKGLIGVIHLTYNNIEFDIAGSHAPYKDLTLDAQGTLWARQHEGEELPSNFNGIIIKRGSKITFKYRTLSNDGVPIEARYWRLG